jgi:hypothetical protein
MQGFSRVFLAAKKFFSFFFEKNPKKASKTRVTSEVAGEVAG